MTVRLYQKSRIANTSYIWSANNMSNARPKEKKSTTHNAFQFRFYEKLYVAVWLEWHLPNNIFALHSVHISRKRNRANVMNIFFLVEWDFENFNRIPKKQIKSMLDNICIFMIEGGKKRQEKCIKQFIREKKKSHPKLRIWETR